MKVSIKITRHVPWHLNKLKKKNNNENEQMTLIFTYISFCLCYFSEYEMGPKQSWKYFVPVLAWGVSHLVSCRSQKVCDPISVLTLFDPNFGDPNVQKIGTEVVIDKGDAIILLVEDFPCLNENEARQEKVFIF